MLSRIKETDVEVPYKEGGYFIMRAPKRASSTAFVAAKRAVLTRRKKF